VTVKNKGGRPRKADRTKMLMIRLAEVTHQRLQERAEEQQTQMTRTAGGLIERELKRK